MHHDNIEHCNNPRACLLFSEQTWDERFFGFMVFETRLWDRIRAGRSPSIFGGLAAKWLDFPERA
jgi:hypothetical protein